MVLSHSRLDVTVMGNKRLPTKLAKHVPWCRYQICRFAFGEGNSAFGEGTSAIGLGLA